MIEDVTGTFSDHEHYQVKCDSCYIVIAECWNWEWEDKELLYSPILCEKCGTERSKDHGAKTKKVEELENKLKELSK